MTDTTTQTEPFLLTAKAVAEATLKAIDEGTLIATQSASKKCLYEDDSGHRCAVGAALPTEVIKKIKEEDANGKFAGVLVQRGLIRVVEDDLQPIARLQGAHDKAADLRHVYGPESEQFVAALNTLKALCKQTLETAN